jgi:hypothetical protein
MKVLLLVLAFFGGALVLGKEPSLVLWLIAGVVYFLPWLVALGRGKANTVSIFLLNLFLGWTLVGWVVSLVWATTQDSPTVVTA